MKLPVLYKRSVNGKISQWQIEVENNRFRTISGYTDGLQVTSEWTECLPKNVGKKNATTPEQQAEAEAQAMFDKRIELGSFINIEDIDKPIYFKPMLAHDFNDYKDKIKYPIYSQPKLDGVRCIVRADGMWSRNGKPIISAPHIFDALKPLFEADSDLILDGELYADKSTTDFNTIISCVRKTKPTAADLKTSAECIEYHIYDVPSVNDVFSKRERYLFDVLELPKCCVKVSSIICHSERIVMDRYKAYMSHGYEGQILRTDSLYENKRSKSLLKHKSFVDGEFTILGVEEGKGNLSSKVGRLNF